MVEHGESSAGSYLADPTSQIPYHCASIAVTSTLRVKMLFLMSLTSIYAAYNFHHLCRAVSDIIDSDSSDE